MKYPIFRNCVFILLILVFISPFKVLSMTVLDASIDELTTESQLVIRGIVISKIYKWENEKQNSIHTVFTIQPTEYIKGNGPVEIKIYQLGGKIDDIEDIIIGTPDLNPDEEVILFLQQHDGKYVIHSMVLGCYKISENENGDKIAINDLRAVNLIKPDSMGKAQTGEKIKTYPVDKFISEIKSNL